MTPSHHESTGWRIRLVVTRGYQLRRKRDRLTEAIPDIECKLASINSDRHGHNKWKRSLIWHTYFKVGVRKRVLKSKEEINSHTTRIPRDLQLSFHTKMYCLHPDIQIQQPFFCP